MLLSYFDLVEEFEYCIWFLYAQKKGIFFVRSLRMVLFSTIIFLILSQYWAGFFYIIFLQWFWIFHIYINEIDYILNEDTNDNADFEYDDLGSERDMAQLITPRSQIIWARSGYLMNKSYSIVQYMDVNILRYDKNLEFLFTDKYNFKIIDLKVIFDHIPSLKKLPRYSYNLSINNNKLIFSNVINNNRNEYIYLTINNNQNFDYYLSKKKIIINYYLFPNILLENFYFSYLDLLKIMKNKNFLLKNHNIFLYFNSIIVSYSYIQLGRIMIENKK